ncbi:MAG: hypothetical protein GY768_18960 [Planctomycetaceae bacterium]|nr:hypothetical protein [Planctomycetaceae bacterium]
MKLPASELYIIYSMSNSPYQQWQADLLDFSVGFSGQTGTIVRLVSREVGRRNEPVNPSAVGYTLVTPSYSGLGNPLLRHLVPSLKRWFQGELHGRFHFYCLNKALAMQCFLESHPELNEEAMLLWLDPDMIFNQPWEANGSMVRPGHVVGQSWWGYDPSWCLQQRGENSEAFCPPPQSAIMFPFCISVADMRRISKTYASVSEAIYQRSRDWKSEMYGLVIAIGAGGLQSHALRAFGTCNNWPDEISNDASAPISHYTQAILNRNGSEIWDKRKYTRHTIDRPWQRPPQPEQAASLTDQRTLRMIHQFIDWQTTRG